MQNATVKHVPHPDPKTMAHTPDNTPKLPETDGEEVQVAVPETVDMTLPRTQAAEIAIPASINGRDLSQGGP